MKYEVLSTLYRCSQIHGQHGTIDEATKCFDQITQQYKGNIPIHPISGKYIHAIVAIGEDGDQKDFGSGTIRRARRIGLGPKAVWTKVPGISTFNRIAKLYHDALQLIPPITINLSDVLDYRNKDKHFWSTDAGNGQALAYVQQAAFTLELSIKALLESLGQLHVLSEREWRIHDPVKLLNLLDDRNAEQSLERVWSSLSPTERPFTGTFSNFLISVQTTYTDLRYIPDLKDANISVDIRNFLSASSTALRVATESLQKHRPFKIRAELKIIASESRTPIKMSVVTGIVKSVEIPDSLDPHSVVNVTIESEDDGGTVTAQFHKRSVEKYHGIKGTKVMLAGYCKEAEPQILESPDHIEGWAPEPSYSQEHRTLQGSIYNVIVQEHDQPKSIIMMLDDETYFTKVHCLFSTTEEQNRLIRMSLGDRILIRGLVTLQNGRPRVLVGPDLVKHRAEEPQN